MKKFEGILICTDLDGTLFKDDKTVSKRNVDAIEYFKSEGGLFTFVTGRMPSFSSFVCDIINPNCPFGCINGGGIYDTNKGYLWKKELSKVAFELVSYIDKKLPPMGIQINTFDKIYFSKENSAMERFRKITNVPNIKKDYRDVLEPVAKVVFADVCEENIFLLEKLLHSHPLAKKFEFIRSEKTLYEILPKGIGKHNALIKLNEIMNIDKKRTVAIGDYNNDIPMLEYAGVGVAVSNASDEAKRFADYITVSNEEDAIFQVIEDIEYGRIMV